MDATTPSSRLGRTCFRSSACPLAPLGLLRMALLQEAGSLRLQLALLPVLSAQVQTWHLGRLLRPGRLKLVYLCHTSGCLHTKVDPLWPSCRRLGPEFRPLDALVSDCQVPSRQWLRPRLRLGSVRCPADCDAAATALIPNPCLGLRIP